MVFELIFDLRTLLNVASILGGDVLGPAVVDVAVEGLHELGKGKRAHAHLVAEPAELRHHVR